MSEDYDLLIKNGLITDGTGAPSYMADIAVRDGRIARIIRHPERMGAGSSAVYHGTAGYPDSHDATGSAASGSGPYTGTAGYPAVHRVIDAAGMSVTPGFIDIHRHADAAAFRPDYGHLELSQGLTTIVNGNCGLSVAPISEEHRQEILRYLAPITGTVSKDVPTGSMGEYLAALKDLPVNTYMLVGAGTLRASAAGYELTKLGDEHFRRIHAAMEQALSEGALGVSLGLGYAPECFYTTDELIRALEPLRGTSIPVTVHMREEGDGVADSVREMMTVARALGCPVHISHLKAMGRENWGRKIPEALKIIENTRADGYEISCDVYPYTAGSTQLMHILPPDFLEGGIECTVRRLKDPAARRELAARIEGRQDTACIKPYDETAGDTGSATFSEATEDTGSKSGRGHAGKTGGAHFDNIARLAGWDGIYMTTIASEQNKIYQGRSIAEAAAMRGMSELDTCCDLLAEEHCQITMIDFMASEEDIETILACPFSNLISDATYPTEGRLHPRVYGTFTHMLEHFVRERGSISFTDAINRMTLKPAQALHLHNKGRIAEGYDADLCIFDPLKIHENATYDDPCRTSEGMEYVIVGGRIKLEKGEACK